MYIINENKETFENIDNNMKKKCRKPSKDNPFANSLYIDYIDNIDIKACDDKESNLLQKKIFNENINIKNKLSPSNIRLNKYYFYQMPSTNNIPNTVDFGKKIFFNNDKSDECKRFNKNCRRR